MRYKTTITIVTYTDEPFDPKDIQEIANEIEHEAGEGSITEVVCVPDPDGEEDNRSDLVIDLSGPDGNIFAIMAKACGFLSKEDATELRRRTTQTHSYDDALAVVNEYVHIYDVSDSRTFE